MQDRQPERSHGRSNYDLWIGKGSVLVSQKASLNEIMERIGRAALEKTVLRGEITFADGTHLEFEADEHDG